MPIREIRIRQFGSANKLEMTESSSSRVLESTEVLVKTAYSGLNFADVQMRLGFYPDAPKRPFVPGYEISGYVQEVGEEVRDIAPGDPVIAATRFGGYASLVRVPQEQVFPLPSGVDLKAGAALPINFITSHIALFEMARIRSGDRVLIECATGGVGTLAMQMARECGAKVVGLTSSPHKKDYIASYGAESMTSEEFYAMDDLGKFDLILNSSGGVFIKRQLPYLSITGRMVCLGISSGVDNGKRNIFKMLHAAIRTPRIPVLRMFDPNIGVFGLNGLRVLEDSSWKSKMREVVLSTSFENIRPHVDEVFKAENVVQAHRYLESKQAIGKVLLGW